MSFFQNRLHHWNLAWRISFSVFFATTFFLAIIAVAFNRAAETILGHEFLARADLCTEHVVDHTVMYCVSVQKIGGLVCSSIARANPTREADVYPILESVFEKIRDLRGVGFVAARGRLDGKEYSAPFCRKTERGIERHDLSTSESFPRDFEQSVWYEQAVVMDEGYWTKPYHSDLSEKELIISCSFPVYENVERTRLLGVVIFDLPALWIDKMIRSIPADGAEITFLLAADGTILSHPNPEMLQKSVFELGPEYRRLAEKMLRAETGNLYLQDREGIISGTVFYRPIPEQNPFNEGSWFLAVLFPRNIYDRIVASLRFWQFAIGIVSFSGLFAMLMFVSKSITSPIVRLEQATRRIAEGDLELEMPVVHGQDEVSRLTNSVAEMRDKIKDHVAIKERHDADLRAANRIQMNLLPTCFPDRVEVDIHAFLKPARQVGGDLYDCFLLDEDRLCVLIGDVVGKGLPASMLMASTLSYFRAVLPILGSPEKACEQVNRHLCANNDNCIFVTLCCLVLRLSDGKIAFAVAGHDPPILNRDGEVRFVDVSSIRGLPLGLYEKQEYTLGEILLQPGDALLLYTDGVTEAMDDRGILFDCGRLIQVLGKCHDDSSEKKIDAIMEELGRFTQNTEQSDDITLVALRFLPPNMSTM